MPENKIPSYGITAVRLDQDGWVEAAEIGEISEDDNDFVAGTFGEKEAAAIAALIKSGAEVYCIFGKVNAASRGPRFDLAVSRNGSETIKLVDEVPSRGLHQLIQLEKAFYGSNNPEGNW